MSVAGKARHYPTQLELIFNSKKEENVLHALIRDSVVKPGSTSSRPIGSALGSVPGSQGGSATGATVFSEPIAFNPKAFLITSNAPDTLRIDQFFGKYTSRIIVTGEGGAADNIEFIVGLDDGEGNTSKAAFAGQILNIEAALTTPLTLIDGADIATPGGGASFLIRGGSNVTLVYDSILDKWKFLHDALIQRLDELLDVTIGGDPLATGHHLEFTGTVWENKEDITFVSGTGADILNLDDIRWIGNHQLARSDTAPHLDLVLNGDTTFRFTVNASIFAELSDLANPGLKMSQPIYLQNENIYFDSPVGTRRMKFDGTSSIDLVFPTTDFYRVIVGSTQRFGVSNTEITVFGIPININSSATQFDAIQIAKDPPSVAGTRDGNFTVLEGASFDTSGHTAQWRYFVNVTLNNGTSIFTLENRIDGAAFATKLQIADNGLLTLAGDLNANNKDFLSIKDIQLQSGFGTSKLFFDGGGDTYFTGSGTSGRINIVNDNAQNYSFLTTEFAIFGGRNILMSGVSTGGFIEMLERAVPTGAADSTRLYSKDVAGLTELFYVNSAGTERDLSAVSGEVNTGQNVGAGTGLIFRDKTGVFINLRSLIGGTNVTITNNANDITINSTGSGANTQLSNLTSPTSINQDLRPDASNRDVGIASDRWKEMNCEDLDTDSTFKHAKGETAGNKIAFFGKVLQTHRTVTRVVVGEALSLTQAKIQSLQDALNDYNLVST